MTHERVKQVFGPYLADVFMKTPPGTHIAVPLDPALLDAGAVEAAAKALCADVITTGGCELLVPWAERPKRGRDEWRAHVRTALAAYLNHVVTPTIPTVDSEAKT